MIVVPVKLIMPCETHAEFLFTALSTIHIHVAVDLCMAS